MIRDLIKITSFSIIFVLMLSGAVFAEPDANGQKSQWHFKHGGKRQQMFQQLNLTEEQRSKIEEHRRQHREQQQALQQQIRQKREQLRQELEKAVIDPARIQQISAGLKNLMGRKVDHRIQGILTMKEILTPEQFSQFQQKAKQFRKKHGGPMGRWKSGQGKFRDVSEGADQKEGL